MFSGSAKALLLSAVLVQPIHAQLREMYPADNAVFQRSSSSSVLTFGAIIDPEWRDDRYDIDYRVKGSSRESTIFLQSRPDATRNNLYVGDWFLPSTSDDYVEYIWRLAVKKCNIFSCWDIYSEWRTLIVTSSSNSVATNNRFVTTVSVDPTQTSDNTIFVLHRSTRNGPIQFIGTSANAVSSLLPPDTYYFEHYNPNPRGRTLRIRVDSNTVYNGALVQNLAINLGNGNDEPSTGGGGGSTPPAPPAPPAVPPAIPQPPSGGNTLCTEDPNRFNICVDLEISDNVSSQGIAAFQQAKNTWESIITGDIIDWSVDFRLRRDLGNEYAGPGLSSGEISKVDDLYIYAKIGPIDGPRGILGQAGPTLGERDNGFLYAKTGFMEFDEADLDQSLRSVILHEMGHVLGLGTLWEANGLYNDPVYRGQNANREYRVIAGAGPTATVPIEQGGGPGTADGHFSEDCMRHELMTGYLSGARQDISRITIGALQDLGYQVDYSKADPYSRSDLNLSRCNRRRGRSLRARHVNNGSSPIESHRQLSEDLRREAIRTGLATLKKKQEASAKINLPQNVVNLGAHFIEVIVMDDNGEIFLVPVVDTMDEP